MNENSIVREDLDRIINATMGGRGFSDTSVLITGCAGFLGYYFSRYFKELLDRGIALKSLTLLDNFMLRRPGWVDRLAQDKRVTVRQFDIAHDRFHADTGFPDADYIIHLASIASPTFYRKYPLATIDANVWGLRQLLDFARDHRPTGLLFFSSSEIYGDPVADRIPTDEEYRGNVSCLGPRACYDEAKRFGETLCYTFAGEFGLPISVVRPFNNYGPGMNLEDKRVPADFAQAVMTGRDIVIHSDGTPTRTFCYISDAITGYLKALLYGKYDYFNIGIEKPEISVNQLAEIYRAAGQTLTGYRGTVRCQLSADKEYLTHNPARRCPDISKARRLLGYEPCIEVSEGVHRFIRFLMEDAE